MRYRGYVILAKDKEGNVLGHTELSFSMGTDKLRVRVERAFEYTRWVKDKPEKLKGQTPNQYAWNELQKRTAKQNKMHGHLGLKFKLFKVGGKNSPIILDWSEVRKMVETKKHDKFKWRNLPFKIKEGAVLNFD